MHFKMKKTRANVTCFWLVKSLKPFHMSRNNTGSLMHHITDAENLAGLNAWRRPVWMAPKRSFTLKLLLRMWICLTLNFAMEKKSVLSTQMRENFWRLIQRQNYFNNAVKLAFLFLFKAINSCLINSMQTYCDLDSMIWKETCRDKGLCPQVSSCWKANDISLANA